MIKPRDHISGNLEDYNSHTELKSCAYTLMLFNTDTLKRLNCQDLNIELFVRYQMEVIIYHKHRSKSNKGAKCFWVQQIYGLFRVFLCPLKVNTNTCKYSLSEDVVFLETLANIAMQRPHSHPKAHTLLEQKPSLVCSLARPLIEFIAQNRKISLSIYFLL